MIFQATPLLGAFVLDIEPLEDARGLFARTVSADEFAQRGLNSIFVQQSVSWNPNNGTLRGLHFQRPPFEEDKLVRVTRGAIFDVIVDIRPQSPTRGHWFAIELSAENRKQIYIPKGFAHGFQTLMSDTEVFYQMTTHFMADAASGILWNDRDLGIAWPETKYRIVGERDAAMPTYEHFTGTCYE